MDGGENSFYNGPINVDSANCETEKFCNAVAAEILIPTERFLEKWESSNDETVKTFRCSRYVAVRKALDKGKISQGIYEEVMAKLTREFKDWQRRQRENKGSGGDYYRNLASKVDKRFVTALARSAFEGKTPYAEVYRLTGTDRKTFGKMYDKQF